MITAIIPARGGSKRIPKKNIKMYCDKPLLVHSIEQAKKSQLIDSVFVTTDDEEIAQISRNSGAQVLMRPVNISEDTSTDFEFFHHFLKTVSDDEIPRLFVQLRPTYPNRDIKVIDKCIQTLLDNDDYTSLRTVIPNEFKTPYKMYNINSQTNVLEPFVNNENCNIPDQSLPQTYIHNGYIDVIFTETLLNGSVTGNKIYPYVLDKSEIHDIDILEDFIESSRNYRKRNKKESAL